MPRKDCQGRLDARTTNAMRGNNEEVIGDCMEACKDYTGAARLCGH